MYTRVKCLSFLLYLFGAILVFFGALIRQAYAEESITLTTYYPAPYGVYNQMLVDRLGVGDSNNNGLDDADLPTNPGTIKISGADNTGIEFTHDNTLQWPSGSKIKGYGGANTIGMFGEVVINPGNGLSLNGVRRDAWPVHKVKYKTVDLNDWGTTNYQENFSASDFGLSEFYSGFAILIDKADNGLFSFVGNVNFTLSLTVINSTTVRLKVHEWGLVGVIAVAMVVEGKP